MPYDRTNIFAKILRGDIPCVKVYEDDHTLAFMDVMPQAEGHTLVVPKEDAENIFELSPDSAAHVMRTAQKVAKAVKTATGASGVMLMQLNGKAAGQSVFHIHMHVIPRQHGLELGFHERDMVSADVLEPIAARIRAALSS
ncbi:histidine triad (HIT) family protein [Rhizomicrobium palustre]|uniref:Histidine triad (HIT) family protein n=1 Tax=Rhizomicrobium palustre TaxID=189966 RepID=A0A846N2Q9_9PROT|nr:HIT family protein [Rhizomicrobium palustre]NIK90218.1 histidine triad (HIT) family protein [Rhizomicrobium palustre]